MQVTSEMPAVELVLEGDASTSWVERHARGEVPGRWPYGLEWLARDGVAVRAVGLPRATRLGRAFSRVALRAPARGRTVGLAWNENIAHRMAELRRHGEMHCGVIWANDSWRRLDARARSGLRRTFARMESVWVLSSAQLDTLDGFVPPTTARHYVPFGIDESFFSPTSYPDRPLLVSVGGDRHRDQATVLKAFKLVQSVRPEVEAVIQSRLLLPDPGRVRIVPHLTHCELRDLYRRATVVAIATHPNLHVSGMTVSLESQATARPVVLTRTPGGDDYVQDGVTGHLVSPGSVFEMAERVLSLVDDPAAAEKMGIAGRATVEQRFTSRAMAARLLEAIGLA